MWLVLIRHGLFSCFFLKSHLLKFVFQMFQKNNFTSVAQVGVSSLWKEIVNPFVQSVRNSHSVFHSYSCESWTGNWLQFFAWWACFADALFRKYVKQWAGSDPVSGCLDNFIRHDFFALVLKPFPNSFSETCIWDCKLSLFVQNLAISWFGRMTGLSHLLQFEFIGFFHCLVSRKNQQQE